jgi:hypothetical protein
LLLVGLSVLAAVPLVAGDEQVIFVRIDTAAKRAYIPEGTVLPERVVLRASKSPVEQETIRDATISERSVPRREAPVRRLTEKDTLIFEYAPAENFRGMQARYAARVSKGPSRVRTEDDRYCTTIYMEDTGEGVYGTYSNGFTARGCRPAGALTSGQYYLFDYTATADVGDDGYVYVSDANGNFNCMDTWPGYGLSCTDENTTQYWVGFSNTITMAGSFSIIEYLDNYEPNYIGFSFESTWYVAHE